MAVCGVGRRRAGRSATTKHTEVSCHACSRSTKVAYKDPDEMLKHLEERGWITSNGAIGCPDHGSTRMMPRHQFGLVAQGGGHDRWAQT